MNKREARQADKHMKTIKIEINNTLVDVRVDIRSLRTALGLPQHDMFHSGIYGNYQHPALDADDNIDDLDHNSNDDNDAHQNSQQQDSNQTNN